MRFMRTHLTSRRLLVIALAASVAHADDKSLVRGIGAGITYPAISQSLLVNPADLTEGSRLNVTGLYRFDPGLASAHLTYNTGTVGLGAGYVQTSSSTGLFQGGFGFRASALRIGAEVHSADGSGLDANIGAIIHLSNLRLGVVARDITGGLSRVDAGLGLRLGQAMIGIDAKFPLGTDPLLSTDETVLLDVGLSVVAANLTVGLGYDTTFNRTTSAFTGGGLHAGLSYGFSGKLFFEGHYRPIAQEWTAGTWAAGLRFMF